MKRVLVGMALVVAGGLGMVSFSGAHDGKPMPLPDTKDVIAMRHYLMENVGDNMKEMGEKLKAGKIAEAKVNAQAITLHSLRVVELFPKGSTSETSKAKEEIWQKWDEFVKSTDTLKTEADRLVMAIGGGKADEVGAQMKKVGGSCKGCHDSFRKPDEKK